MEEKTIIIVPCYNEAGRLKRDSFVEYAENHPSVQFLFVNDGSKDGTLDMLKSLAASHAQIEYLDVQPNGGKAEAVRRGMLYAAERFGCEYIGFWDADLATPLYEIENFVFEMERGSFDMVTGLRLMRLGAKVHRKTLRHFLGRCFATVASNMLRLPVYDTQCGSKLYRRGIVSQIFEEKFITKWLFDVELLSRYVQAFDQERAEKKIYEYPLLQWEDVGGSQVKMKDFFKAPYELMKIRRKYKK